MKNLLCTASALLSLMVAAGALAQQAPQPSTDTAITNTLPTADFGFNLPSRLGTLTYSLSASELFQTGYGNGNVYLSTTGSGNLAYLSKSENNPFSLVYSGGFIHSNAPGYSDNSTFQDLSFSQVFRTRQWVFVISDALSYLPSAPTTGLSGVAGVGDVGVYPVQTGLGPAQSILTDYGRRISNGLNGSATYQITGKTDLEGSASWSTLRFLGATTPGLDSSQYAASVGVEHRINPLNSISANANYSRQVYLGYGNAVIESDGVSVTYNRTWSRAVTTSFSIGPERTHGHGFDQFSSQGLGNFPSRLDASGTASINYAGRNFGAYLSYNRGVNAGSGVVFGAIADTVTLGVTRPFGRSWNLGLNGGYTNSIALVQFGGQEPHLTSIFGGAQLSRRLTDTLSCYASYTGVDQSGSVLSGTVNAFNGLNNIAAIGITFSPPPLHRGR